jgi:hypothetical protein
VAAVEDQHGQVLRYLLDRCVGQRVLVDSSRSEKPADCGGVVAQCEYAFGAIFVCSDLEPNSHHHSEELPEVVEPGIAVKGAGCWDCETPGWTA